jgi:hypothetical protein
MARKLVSAFEVLVLFTTLLFLFGFITDYLCAVFRINWSNRTNQRCWLW